MFDKRFPTVLLLVLAFATTAIAVSIETVPVGNPGNLPDTRYNHWGGSVQHEYRLGKYEVTNNQYAEFLNSVDPTAANALALYNPFMSSFQGGGINLDVGAPNGSKFTVKDGRGLNPVIFVSQYDAFRFTNWLHNGQGNASTESGAYTLLGGTPTPLNSFSIVRDSGAKWWVPSFDEHYKAAFHKNDGTTANYWDTPFSSNSTPYSDQPPGIDAPTPSSTANFRYNDGLVNGFNDGSAVTGLGSCFSQNCLTNVGAYTVSESSYGTFDQGGNVWEWHDRDTVVVNNGIFGGSYINDSAPLLASFGRRSASFQEQQDIGFRVATIPKPTGAPINVAVDFGSTYDTFGGVPTVPIVTQLGFLPWDGSNFQPSASPSIHLFTEGIEFELRAVFTGPVSSNLFGSRNRNSLGGGGGALDDLLQDFVYAEGRPGNFLHLEISGLPPGTYRMTTWHFDSFVPLGSSDAMQIEVGDKLGDTIAAATTVVVDNFRLGLLPQVFEFEVAAAGTIKEIVFRNDNPRVGPGANTAHRTRLNGFTLIRIPEPSACWLGVTALLLLSFPRVRNLPNTIGTPSRR